MSTEAKIPLIQHVCKDFPSFSCQGKGLKGFIVNGEFSGENVFTTLFIIIHVLQSHANRHSQSEST